MNFVRLDTSQYKKNKQEIVDILRKHRITCFLSVSDGQVWVAGEDKISAMRILEREIAQ